MDHIEQWMLDNFAAVIFLYGLSFVIMGSIIAASPKENSRFALSQILWLFVAYAFIHAPADFLSMLTVRSADHRSLLPGFLTYLSYLFLFEFGRRLLSLSSIRIPWQILPVLVILIGAAGSLAADPAVTLNIVIGYGIRLPAGIMSGLGFILYFRTLQNELHPLRVKRYFTTAGVAMLAWAFFCGVIRREGSFFPSTVLNYASFLDTVGLPVQLFRTVCALLVTWAIWGILRIFVYEVKERLEEEIAVRRATEVKNTALIGELKTSLSEIRTLSGLLPICASCKKIRDDKGYWSQIEMYIRKHSNAEFTHGICPDCAVRFYPELCEPEKNNL